MLNCLPPLDLFLYAPFLPSKSQPHHGSKIYAFSLCFVLLLPYVYIDEKISSVLLFVLFKLNSGPLSCKHRKPNSDLNVKEDLLAPTAEKFSGKEDCQVDLSAQQRP